MNSPHIANTLLLVEPVAFGYNRQTATNNYFQQQTDLSPDTVQQTALSEFKELESKLVEAKINLLTVTDSLQPPTPDSVFPNNWISFHNDGRVVLYPMFAPNRRQERRPEILQKLCDDGFYIHDIVDYTISENEGIFLEGTGSMVLDRQNRVAYAALSPRTCESLFRRFCEDFDYHPIIFTAFQTVQGKRAPVYHTNVMMSVADRYAILCAQSIDSPAERKMVEQSLQTAGKEIIEISEQQMQSFAGNMLQVANRAGDKFMIMSKQAYYSLSSVQIAAIESYSGIITAAVPTIEQQGGGSVRCMLAEIFLPRRY